LKKTTDAMHRGLSRAVVELRARMRWGQADLARQITKQGTRARVALEPDRETISRWEHGEQAPSPIYRMALARVASKHGQEDLAELFRAPIIAWRLVGHVKLGLKGEE
jgi:hypothetical protein